MAEVVRRALDRLPQRMRTTVMLRYFEDMTEPEIAAALGISLGTVKARCHGRWRSCALTRSSAKIPAPDISAALPLQPPFTLLPGPSLCPAEARTSRVYR
jgi:hypothetical protein